MYFSNVIGLNDVKQHLIDSVHRGFVPHARIFYGPEGVGKLPLAIAYARYLNCANRGVNDSCGVCPSCQKFDKLAHPDLHFVFPVVKSKVSDDYLAQWRKFLQDHSYFNLNQWLSYIDAENAQGIIYSKESDEIIRKLNLKVYEAPYKIMIIWLPEKMHIACSNKLLKMIEEPPTNTIFLLISEDRENVLQTIWSRCQPLNIRAIEKDEMQAYLSKNFELSEGEIKSIAHIANGSFTSALHMIESSDDNQFLFELFVNMMRASVSGNIKAIREASNQIAGIGREMQKSFILYSLKMFREYFVNNFGEQEMVYLNEYEKKFGERFSPFINERNIEEFNYEFSLAYRQIEQNGNARIIFLELCLRATLLLRK